MILCPKCRAAVSNFSVDQQLVVNRCSACRLIWLDAGEFETFLGCKGFDPTMVEPVGERSSDDPQEILYCPRCDDSHLRLARIQKSSIWNCPQCCGQLLSDEHAARLRKHFTDKRHATFYPSQPLRNSRDAWEISGSKRIPRIDLLAIPLAILLGVGLEHTGFKVFLWFLGMPGHELGHALVSWFGGIFAVPLPFFTYYRDERSFAVIALFLAAWSVGIFAALRLRSVVILWFAVACLLLQVVMSFLIPLDRINEFRIAFGQTGEIVFPALMVAAFVYRFPVELRWDFWRYPVLAIGGVLFGSSLVRWSLIRSGAAPIPWGSVVSNEINDGDFAKLNTYYHWSQADIVMHYSMWLKIAVLWIAIHYLSNLLFTPSSSKKTWW